MANEKNDTAPKKVFEGYDSSNRRELNEDELMQKFFNKKAKPKTVGVEKLYMPVYYENMKRSLIDVRTRAISKITGLENIEVDANEIIAVLNYLVDPDWLVKLSPIKTNCDEKLKKILDDQEKICWMSISAFADPDVIVSIDERALEIRININPKLRSKKVQSISYVTPYTEEVTNEPSWFSSYINMNFSQVFQSDNLVYKNGREPITANFNSGTRFGSFLLEANARGREKRQETPTTEPDFVRENVRGVLDFESIASRSQLGDLTYPVRGFQAYRAMAGVTLFTHSSLKSSLLTKPTESYEIDLVRPSKLIIYINDNVIQTIELPAGRHDLRDFPFTEGQNNIKIEITDDLGRTEVKDYSLFKASQLLKVSEHEISYSLGLPSTDVNGNRNYDSKNVTASIFHRYGLNEYLTLSGNIQADAYQMVGGLEFQFPTKFGYFSIDTGYSLNQNHPSGYATRMQYVLQDLYSVKTNNTQAAENNNKSTAIEAVILSPDFAVLGTRQPQNTTGLRIQTTHSRGLSKDTSINLGLSYNFNREITPGIGDAYTLSVGATRRWVSGVSTSLNFRHSKPASGTEDISIAVILVWSAPKERQFISISTESKAGISRADWTYQPKNGVGEIKPHVNLTNKQSGNGYGGDIEYTANRARFGASHQIEVQKADLSTTPITTGQSVHTTNLNLGTALVFAGGHFSLSRPVYDSFAIFYPLKNIEDDNILLNLQKDGIYSSETDWFGSAVATEIPSYTYSSHILTQSEFTQGVALPKDHFTFRPQYRSGYAISIGTDATIYLKTTLLAQDGSPAAMIAGHATYLDDTSAEVVTVFTNRSGLVRSEGFRHGRYRLEFIDGEYEPIEFVIPETAPDEYDMPALKLKESSK